MRHQRGWNGDPQCLCCPQIDDQLETDRIMNDLMGRDASARFRFIMDRAEEAQEIDV